MKKRNLFANILLLIAAIIWGLAVIAQKKASELGAFTINAIRCLVASAILYSFILGRKIKNKNKDAGDKKMNKKTLFIASALCGLSFAFAYNFQQIGLSLYPDGVSVAGRVGFLTGLYVLFVPILGIVFLKQKIKLNLIIGVFLACVGLYLLCFTKGIDNIYVGDIVTLTCAIFFAIQILIVDKYNGKVEVFNFIAMQLLICGVLCLIPALIIEKPSIEAILKNIWPILYLGVFSNAVADILQVLGQKNSKNPTLASIIMSTESVFALISGVVIFKDSPKINEILGCVVMFAAIIISQIEFKKKNKTLSQ